jgi:hypothetical protein
MGCLRSLSRKARTFLRLTRAERNDLLTAFVLLPTISLRVRLTGFNRTRHWLEKKHRPQTSRLETRAEVLRIVRVVRIGRRYHRFWTNCLSHSLTLWTLLNRAGIASEIRVGARLEEKTLLAHAWVEWQGEPLNDPDGMNEVGAAFHRPLVSL